MAQPNLQSEQDFPTEVLKNELKRREEDRKAACNLALAKHQQLVADNIETLLKLVPDHSRTSCSDENPNNSSQCRCTRCVLLGVKRCGSLDYNVAVLIHANPTDPDNFQ